MMDPDLVIMDEFQRFKNLIKTEAESEVDMLAGRFFNIENQHQQKLKVLLLSATPYKLYSTMEEIHESQVDEHYREFIQVADFLFENDPIMKNKFHRVWRDYSLSLKEINTHKLDCLIERKTQAEDALYQCVCRTERLAVEKTANLLSIESSKNKLDISVEDVLSYIRSEQLIKELGLNSTVPVDYIKSAPYIFSFMEHYKLKEKVTDYFKHNHDKLKIADQPELWIDENKISMYEKLPYTNARLKRLEEEALPNGAEMLMWIPPSKPYYQSGGPFANFEGFSKIKVFSTLREMCRMLLLNRSALGKISGVGEVKLNKYGERFLEVITRYPVRAAF